jgi:ferredoxin
VIASSGGASAMKYTVRITNTDEVISCVAPQNLLYAMEALGRKGIPVGCRGGGCGVCKLRVESGTVENDTMSRSCVSVVEERQGFVLACRSRPTSDLTVTAVDRLARCVQRGFDRAAGPTFLARATGETSKNKSEGDLTCR